jgi:DNA-binding response OmpR family regulator
MSQKKIMIVDDDPAITRYLDVLFQENGYKTCIADDGKNAMDVFRAEAPDLITLDLEMPEEWGPRFFRRLSKTKGVVPPVIVISGLSGRKYSIPKAEGFFAKPFDKDELLKTIGEILAG